MPIKKSSWILVGIFLWGVPTAVFLSILLAVKKPGTWFESQAFQSSVFTKSLLLTLPLFMIIGIILGLWLNRWISKL